MKQVVVLVAVLAFARAAAGQTADDYRGTCDSPYTMAELDDFSIEGDTLKFNILHED